MNHKYCISVSGQRESNRNKSTPIEIGKSRTGRDSSHMTRMTHRKWVISEFSAFKSEDRYMDINYKIRTKLFSKEQDKKGFHSGHFSFLTKGHCHQFDPLIWKPTEVLWFCYPRIRNILWLFQLTGVRQSQGRPLNIENSVWADTLES